MLKQEATVNSRERLNTADKNNDGQIDNSDKTTIGYGYPKYTVGWSNLVTYGNFEFSFLITVSRATISSIP